MDRLGKARFCEEIMAWLGLVRLGMAREIRAGFG